MIQKVLKIGSSAGVTIPKKALAPLHIKIGDKINVEVNRKIPRIIIEPLAATLEIDEKIAKLTLDFIKRYRKDLEALANK